MSTKLTRPENWKEQAPEPIPGSLTFAAQSSLPKLPVPRLEDTLARLKDTLKPIAWSEDEFNTVSKKIDAFGSGQGPELHKRLLEHDKGTKHWLEKWWDDGAYLSYRDSVRLLLLETHSGIERWNTQVVVNVSYYCASEYRYAAFWSLSTWSRWFRRPSPREVQQSG